MFFLVNNGFSALEYPSPLGVLLKTIILPASHTLQTGMPAIRESKLLIASGFTISLAPTTRTKSADLNW